MADDLDVMLRDAFERAAQPGDPAGVADAIRSRLAAGDAGVAVTGSTAPGWGGALGWLPWLGVVVATGLVGATLGVLGIIPTPFSPEPAGLTSTVAVPTVADAYLCPAGPLVTTIPADSEVLAIARDEDGAYLGIRDPRDVASTVWVSIADVETKVGEPALDALPIGACPVVTVETVTPTPTPTPEQTQAPGPNPPAEPDPPAQDTTAPTIGAISVQSSNCYFLVTVPASDDVGVTAVSLTWTGPPSQTLAMQPQGGGVWRVEVSGSADVYGGTYTFVATARDAAGHATASAPKVQNIQCLI